ncbi:hypothetical protein [Tsukamurella sp. PLM1]|uniref:hypothetical protein n=1 Tax=Tsukamurella sp. PLM1 TaxID=2929795 RepID=UPI0020BF73DB|nr:hypothetical protein [Tsukamurella sp. PLM1]
MRNTTRSIERAARATVRAGRYLDRQSALHIQAPDGALHATPLGVFLSRKINWLFLVVALIMWAVAWPTLNEQFHVPAAVLPIISGFSVLPIAIAWAHPGPRGGSWPRPPRSSRCCGSPRSRTGSGTGRSRSSWRC